VAPWENPEVRIDPNKGRIQDASESPRERELRGRLDKAEREIETLKRRLPPEPVPLDGQAKKP
jgi:hypothetical protein